MQNDDLITEIIEVEEQMLAFKSNCICLRNYKKIKVINAVDENCWYQRPHTSDDLGKYFV